MALHGLALRLAPAISRVLAFDVVSETDGGIAVTSRVTRSCRRSAVAWMIGSAWKRSRITPSSRALAMAVIVMPWWWAMKERTTATCSPFGTRPGVKSKAS